MALLHSLYEHVTYTKAHDSSKAKHHYGLLADIAIAYVRYNVVLPNKIRQNIPPMTLDRQFEYVRPDELMWPLLKEGQNILELRREMLGQYKNTELDLFQACGLASVARARFETLPVFNKHLLADWFGVSYKLVVDIYRDVYLPVLPITLFDLTASYRELGTYAKPSVLRSRYIALLNNELQDR